jgi:hypothetical protein
MAGAWNSRRVRLLHRRAHRAIWALLALLLPALLLGAAALRLAAPAPEAPRLLRAAPPP